MRTVQLLLLCALHWHYTTVKGGAGRSIVGGQRGQTSRSPVDKTEKLFRKYSGGDDQMDAAEFAASLKDILARGIMYDCEHLELK